MVEAACQTAQGHSGKAHLRPLHMMNFHNEDLQEVDLTAAAVLAGGNSQQQVQQDFQSGLATTGVQPGGGYQQ